MYIGAAIFVIVFCAIEMTKPNKPDNLEPEIYNMEGGGGGARQANSLENWILVETCLVIGS